MRSLSPGDSIERRARRLSVLFAEIVLGAGAVGCAPATPGGTPDAASVDVTALPPPASADAPVASAHPASSPTSRVEERPAAVEVGGVCDPGAKSTRVGEGAANMVHGLNPKEPIDYAELILFGQADGGTVLMASGKKCGSAKDWRTCLSKVGRAAPPEGAQGFQPGCIPGGCLHGLLVNRGDDVFVISSAAGIADFLGPIDTPSEALLIAFANEYSAKDGHYGTCDLAKGKGLNRTKDGGFEFVATRTTSWCPISTATARLHVAPNGQVKEAARLGFSGNGPCAGRRPAGFAGTPAAAPGTDPVGAYLLDLACLEAASIGAFADLARELGEHDAPPRMVRAALRARADEIRHARVAARHARRYGALRSTRRRRTGAGKTRSLIELACENEIEGCVREAYGALVATYQARSARDPKLAAMFEAIARDETRHFALAIELREHFRSRLSRRAWRSVVESRARALAELQRELDAAIDPRLSSLAGVPGPEVAVELLGALDRTLRSSDSV
ncbi:MAG: hypothetical protein HOV80_01970 [Polyangiaceae bacterium]|nr:hypothetical protein [Polyangiaceae bacterium]